MFFFFVTVALVAVSNADPIALKSNSIFPNGRIVGGEDATIETYPYQVSIEVYGSHNCGGSIISANWILTAGHCVGIPHEYLTIRAGTSTMRKGGSVHQVSDIIRHEKYHTGRGGVPINDIALIRVEEPFEFDDTRQPIDLYEVDEEASAGVNSVITGWGNTGSGLSSQLQTVAVPIITKELCSTAYETWGGLNKGMICAAYYGVGGKDACQGDSGGPLAIDGRLAGVVSWGNGCAQAYYPGVYTEVAYFRDWVKEHAEV